ncbi:MAG: L-aspartate oxidase [Gammaproteobacteria bacterium]|nr:MAG: L-aspartate oxidase [Gammaproteobacteria bacterium]
MTESLQTDVLVIGGGAAGLALTLQLAESYRVTLVAKSSLTEGSSLYAQGGIASVSNNDNDSFDSHIEDTITAGAGLCHRDVVEAVVKNGPEALRWLAGIGVPFSCNSEDEDPPSYHLTREGGHSSRRVFHAADTTGKAISITLEARVREHRNVSLLEHHIAVDLITSEKLGLPGTNRCLGLYALNKNSGKVKSISSRFIVLATGGASKVYLYTSNPDTSTGDGMAMAWRAGCRVANMEFIQFHPTCLYHPQAKSFLISEALRGEGARLLLPDGSAFMSQHHERAELAPRDVVARAIDYEMKRAGIDCVYLDISHKPVEFIKKHFPTIYQRCFDFGIDISKDPIPVVPAAHYTCGGIMTDLNGVSDLPNLYAVGECAFTGLHGANRLASNSLLECIVFAHAAARHINQQPDKESPALVDLPPWDESRVSDADEQVVVSHNWDELRHFMWDYVGIVRTNKRLERAEHRVNLLIEEIRDYYANFVIDNDLIELRNLVLVAALIIESAKQRKESRGLHFTRDYPETDSSKPAQDTILSPDRETHLAALASV